jgi:hypothetical protein
MRSRRLALTGPSAAALYELDGFREITWPDLWCAPYTGHPGDRIIRTRDWVDPTLMGDTPVCQLQTVLRHLNAVPTDLLGVADLAPQDRVELAVEHALRLGITVRPASGGAMPGDDMLRAVLQNRGAEPPTESYAETRAVQLFRTFGLRPWRQIPVLANGRIAFRADFMVPFRPGRRPDVIRPSLGLLVEIDGREVHEPQFERDHRRGSTYDSLGFNWVSFTPTQVETTPKVVRKALEGSFTRAGHRLCLGRAHNPEHSCTQLDDIDVGRGPFGPSCVHYPPELCAQAVLGPNASPAGIHFVGGAGRNSLAACQIVPFVLESLGPRARLVASCASC